MLSRSLARSSRRVAEISSDVTMLQRLPGQGPLPIVGRRLAGTPSDARCCQIHSCATLSSVLSQHKRRRRVDRLEVRDIQIVHSHLYPEPFFDEGHQLDREQGIHDSRVEQVVVVTQLRDGDRAQDETSDGLFDLFRRTQGRLRGSRSHVLYLRINMKTSPGLPSQMAGMHQLA